MITAFSMRANGWVNFKMPDAPGPNTIARGRAIMFPMVDASLNKEADRYEPFAYATKDAAEHFNIDQPSIPREWVKVMPIWPVGE